jgi:hypothetical protein
MKDIFLTGAALALAFAMPATAQQTTGTVELPVRPQNAEQGLDAFTEAMTKAFAAKPLNAEQEARLPIAREVVRVMTPDGFYADVMREMMGSMLAPLTEMIGGPAAAGNIVERQVGIAPEKLPDLSDEQRTQIVALLDPAAKQRAAALMTNMTGAFSQMFGKIEAPFRDGFSKAFAARFSESELRNIRAFFATPVGAAFARQSFAIYADPQVMSASMSMVPSVLESMPQMLEGIEKSVAHLPKERGYADLSSAERRQLARLLGMNEAQLRQAMNKAEQAREKEQAQD